MVNGEYEFHISWKWKPLYIDGDLGSSSPMFVPMSILPLYDETREDMIPKAND